MGFNDDFDDGAFFGDDFFVGDPNIAREAVFSREIDDGGLCRVNCRHDSDDFGLVLTLVDVGAGRKPWSCFHGGEDDIIENQLILGFESMFALLGPADVVDKFVDGMGFLFVPLTPLDDDIDAGVCFYLGIDFGEDSGGPVVFIDDFEEFG